VSPFIKNLRGFFMLALLYIAIYIIRDGGSIGNIFQPIGDMIDGLRRWVNRQ
jgi:hypothetical protein